MGTQTAQQEQHRKQQAETAAYLKKQMETKRLQGQMWHKSSLDADQVLLDTDRRRQAKHTEKTARNRMTSIEVMNSNRQMFDNKMATR